MLDVNGVDTLTAARCELACGATASTLYGRAVCRPHSLCSRALRARVPLTVTRTADRLSGRAGTRSTEAVADGWDSLRFFSDANPCSSLWPGARRDGGGPLRTRRAWLWGRARAPSAISHTGASAIIDLPPLGQEPMTAPNSTLSPIAARSTMTSNSSANAARPGGSSPDSILRRFLQPMPTGPPIGVCVGCSRSHGARRKALYGSEPLRHQTPL
jgi:hypothetical protein